MIFFDLIILIWKNLLVISSVVLVTTPHGDEFDNPLLVDFFFFRKAVISDIVYRQLNEKLPRTRGWQFQNCWPNGLLWCCGHLILVHCPLLTNIGEAWNALWLMRLKTAVNCEARRVALRITVWRGDQNRAQEFYLTTRNYDLLRAGRSGDRIPVRAKIPPPST
jgi:hypothetical protein